MRVLHTFATIRSSHGPTLSGSRILGHARQARISASCTASSASPESPSRYPASLNAPSRCRAAKRTNSAESALDSPSAAGPIASLTRRELEVLALIAEGATDIPDALDNAVVGDNDIGPDDIHDFVAAHQAQPAIFIFSSGHTIGTFSTESDPVLQHFLQSYKHFVVVSVSDGLHVRVAPGLDSDILGTALRGAKLGYIKTQGVWIEVALPQNVQGWVDNQININRSRYLWLDRNKAIG